VTPGEGDEATFVDEVSIYTLIYTIAEDVYISLIERVVSRLSCLTRVGQDVIHFSRLYSASHNRERVLLDWGVVTWLVPDG
jgi:hypothetical protein